MPAIDRNRKFILVEHGLEYENKYIKKKHNL